MKDDFTPSEYFETDEKVFKYGANFRKARKDAKLTQIDAAEKIGIAVNSLRLYEADKRIPSVVVMSRMADVYHVTLDYLFSGKDYGIHDHTETRLLNECNKLNFDGKRKAAERVEELTEIKRYMLPIFQEASDSRYRRSDAPPAPEGAERPPEGTTDTDEGENPVVGPPEGE